MTKPIALYPVDNMKTDHAWDKDFCKLSYLRARIQSDPILAEWRKLSADGIGDCQSILGHAVWGDSCTQIIVWKSKRKQKHQKTEKGNERIKVRREIKNMKKDTR